MKITQQIKAISSNPAARYACITAVHENSWDRRSPDLSGGKKFSLLVGKEPKMSWSAPEDWSRWDPDRLMVCPYDESHRIKAKRFQHHLLKCRKNHPDKDFVTCPFNAKHVMLRHEIRYHVSRCPDRVSVEQCTVLCRQILRFCLIILWKPFMLLMSSHLSYKLIVPVDLWPSLHDRNIAKRELR